MESGLVDTTLTGEGSNSAVLPPRPDSGRAGFGIPNAETGDREYPAIPFDGEHPAPIAGGLLGALAVTAVLLRSSHATANLAVTHPGWLRLQARMAVQTARGWFDHLPRRLPIPGYSRYDESDPLENDQRAQLYDEITASPGRDLGSVVERTTVSRSSARYHLRILEHEGLVATEKLWGKRRLYPADTGDLELHAALCDETTRSVLDAIARHEPASGTTLATELDRDASTVTHHLDRLAKLRLVDRERDGRAVVNRLTPAAREALGAIPDGSVPGRFAHSTD